MEILKAPGVITDAQVLAYKCDECEQVRVVMVITMSPPSDAGEDAEPVTMAFQVTDDCAAAISIDIAEELKHPVPGAHGGVAMALRPPKS